MPDFELLAIVCDPRLKLTFFDDIAELAEDTEYWLGIGVVAKKLLVDGITKSIIVDRARVVTARLERASAAANGGVGASAATGAAAAAAPAAAAPAALPMRSFGKISGLAHRAKGPRPDPMAVPAGLEPAATIARRDVDAYFSMPTVDAPLMPNGNASPYDPLDAWIHESCTPSGAAKKSFTDGASKYHSFLATNALRFLGGHAAAGKPERDFSFCGYVNQALRSSQKASTIERNGFNKLNDSSFGPSISAVKEGYFLRHPKSKKRKEASETAAVAIAEASGNEST
jgi:hypothetical protein